MKSYNHLWEKFISEDNIKLAIRKSSLGKRNRKDVNYIIENQDKYIHIIKKYAENFHNEHHTKIEIYDGITRKKRNIICPTYYEQIVHHMAMNIMIPIFQIGMYEHSYGSLPNRGCHKAKKVIEKWIRNKKKQRHVKYCLQMDIKKYFDNISQDVLVKMIENKIHDKKFCAILKEIISVTDKGIPLGFYTSQWIANWYLQSLDHYIKEELHAKYYVRYMDDMVIFGSNKRELHKIKNSIENFLNDKLKLKLKENFQVFRFHYFSNRDNKYKGRFLDFLGFRFYRHCTCLRRKLMLRATRKAKKLSNKLKPTIYDLRQMLSYYGWIKCTDTYNMYLKYIKPYVSIQYCKRRISNYDRKYNRRCLT